MCDETSSEILGGIWVANTPYGAFGNYANLMGYDGTDIVVAVADTGLSNGAAGNAGHVDFNTNSSLLAVRIDPSRGPGKIKISAMRLTNRDGKTLREWTWTVPIEAR